MKKKRTLACLVGAAALSLAIAGCAGQEGGASGSQEADSSSTLKIAMFDTEGNSYLTKRKASAQETAKEIGAELTYFDAGFDPQTQLDQIETAFTRGGYDAFMIPPLDGNLLCDYLTQTVIPSGVAVMIYNGPICGRDSNKGDDLWEPGTIGFVGGQTADTYDAWLEYIKEENPEGGKVAVVSGPPLIANTNNLNTSLELLGKGFDIVANQTTDHTAAQAYAATQAILQANPDLDIIISNYSGHTQGVVQAIEEAGRSDEVSVYDMGGDTWSFQAIESGQIVSTVMLLPGEESRQAVLAIRDAAEGKDVPPFIDLTQSDVLPGTPFVTAENIGEFTPEY